MKNVDTKYDYVIIGAGIGGITTAALLASEGKKVCVLERHYALGGYAHSFHRPTPSGKDYIFCAHVHYVFNCLEGEDGHTILKKLGLEKEITFSPLNPNGFDRLRFPDFEYDIVKGFDRNIEKLRQEFPEYEDRLKAYFTILENICSEIMSMPINPQWYHFVLRPWALKSVLKYRKWTLQDLFNKMQFPEKLQSILAGQMADIALPPRDVSLIIHASNTTMYDKGACVPDKGFEHMFLKIGEYINTQEDCAIRCMSEVASIKTNGKDVTGVMLSTGETLHAKNYIYNGDPKMLRKIIGERKLPTPFNKKLNYDYSCGSFVVYLGLKDIDLTQHGFGDWNVWYFPENNLNNCFDTIIKNKDLSDPTLFISTPSISIKEASHPDGCHQMVIETFCPFSYFKDVERNLYEKEKEKITNAIVDILEKKFIPNIRDHIDFIEAGTPLTNRRYVHAPEGNMYGQSLSPKNIKIGKINYETPFTNLFLIGATAGIPSIGGGLHCSLKLVETLLDKQISS